MTSKLNLPIKARLKSDVRTNSPLRIRKIKNKRDSIAFDKLDSQQQNLSIIKKNIDLFLQKRMKKSKKVLQLKYSQSVLAETNEIQWEYSQNNVDHVPFITQKSVNDKEYQQNNMSSNRFDESFNDGMNMEIKPVNWKLQKLEKDFLLNYLNGALRKYNKGTCKHLWLPSKNKDYVQREPINMKPSNKGLYPSLRSLNMKPGKSLFPCKTQTKHKFSQTVDTQVHLSADLFIPMKDFSLRLVNQLNKAIDNDSVKPLLELKEEEINQFYAFLKQLSNESIDKSKHSNLKIHNIRKDNLISDSSDTDVINISKPYLPTDNLKPISELIKDEQTSKIQIVQPSNQTSEMEEYESGYKATEHLEEIKDASERLSFPYSTDKDSIQPPVVDAVFDDFVEYKTHVASIENDDTLPKDTDITQIFEGSIENLTDFLMNKNFEEKTVGDDKNQMENNLEENYATVNNEIVEEDQFGVKDNDVLEDHLIEEHSQTYDDGTHLEKKNDENLTIGFNSDIKLNVETVPNVNEIFEDLQKTDFSHELNEESPLNFENDKKNKTEELDKQLSDENFLKIKETIQLALGQADERIVNLMTNKNELYELVLLVDSIIKSLTYKLPPIDGMGTGFLLHLASIQTDAKLSRMTNEIDPGEEILYMYAKISNFIDEKRLAENSIQLLVDNVYRINENNRNIASENVKEIIDNPELLSAIINLIHYKHTNIGHDSLIRFFNNLPGAKSESESQATSANETVNIAKLHLSDSVYETEIIAKCLVIIQLWNRQKEVELSVNGIVQTLQLSRDIRMINTDIDNLKEWLAEIDLLVTDMTEEKQELYLKSDIFLVYQEFILLAKEIDNSMLHDIFHTPNHLYRFLSKISTSYEVIIKMSSVFESLKSKPNPLEYSKRTLSKNDQIRIRKFLKDEELVRQLCGLVEYWVNENGVEVSTDFQNDAGTETYLADYRRNDIKDQLFPELILNVIGWLNDFIDAADPETTPQDIVKENFYSTNFYLLKDILKPNQGMDFFFDNPQLFLELLYKLERLIINANTNLDLSDEVSLSMSQAATSKFDKMKSERTEPISISPKMSYPHGRHRRFSNSEAENKEKYSENNGESTCINLSSLIAMKNKSQHSLDDQIAEDVWEDNNVSVKVKSLESPENEIPSQSKADKLMKTTNDKALEEKTSDSSVEKRDEHLENVTVIEIDYDKQKHDDVSSEPLPKTPPKSIHESSAPLHSEQSDNSIVLQKYELMSDKELYQTNFVDTSQIEHKDKLDECGNVSKMSFNSQMNLLNIKLDKTIASIHSYYEEIRDLDMNNWDEVEMIICDKSSSSIESQESESISNAEIQDIEEENFDKENKDEAIMKREDGLLPKEKTERLSFNGQMNLDNAIASIHSYYEEIKDLELDKGIKNAVEMSIQTVEMTICDKSDSTSASQESSSISKGEIKDIEIEPSFKEEELVLSKKDSETEKSDESEKKQKLSFNSQMNQLSNKLDDAIASIHSYYDEIKDLELDEVNEEALEMNDEEVVMIICDKSSISNESCKSNIVSDFNEPEEFGQNLDSTAIIANNKKSPEKSLNYQNDVEIAISNIGGVEKVPDTSVTGVNPPREQELIPIHRSTSDDEDIISTLGFLVYYLLTIISSNKY